MRLLHLEDEARDAELIAAHLERLDDVELVWVRDGAGFRAALAAGQFDAAICDYSVPDLEEGEALALVRELRPELPVIVVSGMVGEEAAVDLIKQGFTDYVMKDRLARLAPAVERAIQEAEVQRARISAQRALRDSELRLRFLLDRLPVVIWTLDGELRIRSVVGGGLDRLPFYPTDVEGLALTELPTPAVGQMAQHLRRVLTGAGAKFETPHEGRWYETSAVPLFGAESGEVVIAMTADVSDRRLLEEQAVATQRLEAVGQLAGGLAHDFNNMLTVIRTEIDMLRSAPPNAGELKEALVVLEETSDRAAELTRQLLALGRRQTLDPQVVSLSDVVLGCEKLLRSAASSRVELAVIAPAGQARVRADRSVLEQVLVNLVANARDAMPSGGHLEVRVEQLALDPRAASWAWAPPAGRYALLTVADTGEGMDEATRSRIFEPFFTTKAPGKGTGLGLASAYGIVRQSGGAIWVASHKGVGTAFKIYLPLEEAVAALPLHEPASQSLSGGALVVDPDRAARQHLRASLEALGLGVLEAGDEAEALMSARRLPHPIDLVVCEAFLPRLEGPALLAELRSHHPRLRAVFTSGLPQHLAGRGRAWLSGAPFVEKPIGSAELARAVARALEDPRGAASARAEPGA